MIKENIEEKIDIEIIKKKEKWKIKGKKLIEVNEMIDGLREEIEENVEKIEESEVKIGGKEYGKKKVVVKE